MFDRIYIWQYEQWWSLTIASWRRLVVDAIGNGVFDLDDYGKRIMPPYRVAWNAGAKHSKSIVAKPGYTVYTMICDWSEDDWKVCEKE